MTVFLVVAVGLWLLVLSGVTVWSVEILPPPDKRSTLGRNFMFVVQVGWLGWGCCVVLLVLTL